jgi:hypothetical protein
MESFRKEPKNHRLAANQTISKADEGSHCTAQAEESEKRGMIAGEIRALIAQSTNGINFQESGTCPSGMGIQLMLLGEIAAQLAEFNQNFCELKHQITQGYVNVIVRPK